MRLCVHKLEIELLVSVVLSVVVSVVSFTISFGVVEESLVVVFEVIVLILLWPIQGLAHLEHGGLVASAGKVVPTRVRKKVHLSNEVSQVMMFSSTRMVA